MKEKVSIVGAGLVGSLLGLTLKQKGFNVTLYEKRADPRKSQTSAGRSINLALSRRGILPLKSTRVYDKIAPYLIPMTGRMMHDAAGQLSQQPYGKEGQFINSVSRGQLNELLITEAERIGVEVHFGHKCEFIDFDQNRLRFDKGKQVDSDLIIGTDGAFSSIRKQMQYTDRFNFSQYYIEHGYKELTIPPIDGEFALPSNYLHIWPRGNFMLIALPNFDRSFTCTLFFPFEGTPSFSTISSKTDVMDFFWKYFSDVSSMIPDLSDQFEQHPTSSLITTQCFPWHKNRTMLLGDASHAIVPFYGQGMNSGFEDVRLFVEMAEEMNWDWDQVLPAFSNFRKKDADAISELALHNFIEMRDHVGDPEFLNRKRLEVKIQEAYPEEWIPLYSMVTFSDLPYSEALRLGKIQKKVIDEYWESDPETIDLKKVVDRFNTLKKAD